MNNDNSPTIETIRHSAAHIMAEAVLSFFPDARFGIGPSIDDGFYYDFELSRSLTPDDLPLIEKKMKEIIKSRQPFNRRDLTKDEARELFKDQPYKLELINELPDETVGVYTQGDFTDLCRGPHLDHTGGIRAIKLLSIAGAYWRGDEKNPMLQRIYGTAFESKDALNEYLNRIEEAKKRDHRKLGKELDLFILPEEIGSGLAILTPKGGRIRTLVEDYWRQEHYANGYELLYTPHIGLSKLWEISGHLDHYADIMYSPIIVDEQKYYLKPMNCPFHMMAYKSRLRSYRELPLRWAELGTVYRYEKSGTLHGLLRVRGFTQDDAHIICTPEQMNDEVAEVLRFSLHILGAFGFNKYNIYLSTRPDDAIGDEKQWKDAEDALRQVIEKSGLPFKVDEGGGAFYGPKIDIKVEDAIGREWQLSTIQFDWNETERFDLTYVGADGQEHRPYMIHRALMGTWERFFGVLIEHYAGAFPAWLAPVQVKIIPVADRHNDAAFDMMKELKKHGIRAEADDRSERMNLKIRQAQLEKIPYMIVLGDKEIEENTVAVRCRDGEQLPAQSLDGFIEHITAEITSRS